MDSMPPAMKASPAAELDRGRRAIWIACMEEPQKRLTVVPAHALGQARPAAPSAGRRFSPLLPLGHGAADDQILDIPARHPRLL